MAIKIKFAKPASKRTAKSSILFAAVIVCAAIVLVGFIAFSILYFKYQGIVDERLKQPIFANTAKIYAAPRDVRPGQKLTVHWIADELRDAGYTGDGAAQPSPLGTYSEGVQQITVVNRRFERAQELAQGWRGRAVPWVELPQAMADADLVISATAADEPIVTRERFAEVEALRFERPLLILDLSVPRAFDSVIGDQPNVYLYSIDDLQAACGRNRADRDKELPAAMRIVEQEAARFTADVRHRAVGPVIAQLRQGWKKPKDEELERLLKKLPELSDHAREEIRHSFDRLVNKLLHPPLESLRDESRRGVSRSLLDALTRLFQLKD